jgi:hypothetical protein
MQNIISRKNRKKKHKKTSKKNYKRNSKSITRNKLIKLIARKKSRKIQYGGDLGIGWIVAIIIAIGLFVWLVMHVKNMEKRAQAKQSDLQAIDDDRWRPRGTPVDSNSQAYSEAEAVDLEQLESARVLSAEQEDRRAAAASTSRARGHTGALNIENIKKLLKELTTLETELSMKNWEYYINSQKYEYYIYRQTNVYASDPGRMKLEQESIKISDVQTELKSKIKAKIRELYIVYIESKFTDLDKFYVQSVMKQLESDADNEELIKRKSNFKANEPMVQTLFRLNKELIDLQAQLSIENRNNLRSSIISELDLGLDSELDSDLLSIEEAAETTNKRIRKLESDIEKKYKAIYEETRHIQDVTAGGGPDQLMLDSNLEIMIDKITPMTKLPYFSRMLNLAVTCCFITKKENKEKIAENIREILSSESNDLKSDKLKIAIKPFIKFFRTDPAFSTAISKIPALLSSTRKNAPIQLLHIVRELLTNKNNVTTRLQSFRPNIFNSFNIFNIFNINISGLFAFRKPLSVVDVKKINELEELADINPSNSAAVKTKTRI